MASNPFDRDNFQQEEQLMNRIHNKVSEMTMKMKQRMRDFYKQDHRNATGTMFHGPVHIRSNGPNNMYMFIPVGSTVHQTLANMWHELIKVFDVLMKDVVDIRGNIFANEWDTGQLTLLYSTVESMFKKLNKDVKEPIKQMESFLKRLQHPDEYSDYELFGFGKSEFDQDMAELNDMVGQLTDRLKPYADAAKAQVNREKKKQEEQTEAEQQNRMRFGIPAQNEAVSKLSMILSKKSEIEHAPLDPETKQFCLNCHKPLKESEVIVVEVGVICPACLKLLHQ
jgi:hypothetical protein